MLLVCVDINFSNRCDEINFLLCISCCLFSEPALVPKSQVLIDVKPWDDETGKFKFVPGFKLYLKLLVGIFHG